jgi:hypothetical protein
MSFTRFACLALFCGGLYLTASQGPGACKDYFSNCTENGCGILEYATACKVGCLLSNGTIKDLKCGTPGSPGEGGEPTPAAP